MWVFLLLIEQLFWDGGCAGGADELGDPGEAVKLGADLGVPLAAFFAGNIRNGAGGGSGDIALKEVRDWFSAVADLPDSLSL